MSDDATGFLVKQGGKFKSWRKRYFVLSGLRLRWYENREAFEAHGLAAARGEIACGSIVAVGAGKACIKDSRGGRDLLVRSEMG